MVNQLNNLPPVLSGDQKYILARYNTIDGNCVYWSADTLEADYENATRMSLLTAIEIRTTLDSLPKIPNHALALLPQERKFEEVVEDYLETLRTAKKHEH